MKRFTLIACTTLAMLTSCVKDLDTEPLNTRISTASSVFKDPEAFKQSLAKLYGSMTLTGQRGEFGQPEISAPDEGTTSFMRVFFSAQEMSTDEVINAWGDAGLSEFHEFNWSAQNGYLQLLYQRIFINIAYCNEFIREASARVDGLQNEDKANVQQYVAEAKFLRAYFYYCALDLWGNVPFVTEADAPGAYLPKQIKRADLFDYIQKELDAIIPALAPAGKNEYARADQAAAWTLLARLNLNAEVYLGAGSVHYTEAITYCNNVINSGMYSLNPSYPDLFKADNDRLRNEIIFPIAEDGNNTRNYGGMTFIIHAASGGAINLATNIGISSSGGWAGNRSMSAFANKFPDPSGNTDKRAMFFTTGQTLDISQTNVFTQGYLVTKYKNVTSAGVPGQNDTFVDTDFPLFRLADVYLMYAEAVVRGGGGGSAATALGYINDIRTRAYGNASGNITAAQLTLPFLIDERGRELYWECTRRTDLIRFGLFTSDQYLWDWKGNVKEGAGVDAHFSLFTLPSSDLAINTNLVQNPGY